MTKSMKASRSRAKEARRGCWKREKSICGADGEGPSETKIRPLKYGYVSILGRTRVMEDAMMVVPPRKLPGGYSFFAAYGGRGKETAAEMCADKLHHCLAEKHRDRERAAGELQWGKLVTECFSCMYEDISGTGNELAAAETDSERNRMMKLTAVVVAVDTPEVVVVNCGGSRAVLWSGGVVSPLWSDHNKKTEEADGDDRVEADEGRRCEINHDHDFLSTSSINQGDECLKNERISEAEVTTVLRQNDSSEDFLIIASDGLWSVVGKEMACQVVRQCQLAAKIRRPSEGGGAASQAAAMLAELAIAKGSKHNISVIVLLLASI